MLSARRPLRRSQRGFPARRTARMPRVSRVLSGIAIAGLLAATVAGCGTGQVAQTSAARPAPASAWQRTLDRVHRNGHVSTATALAAFVLAIGPIPGIRPVTGPAQVIPSGTVAVQWTLGHWRQLTPRQRRAVLSDLGARRRGAGRTTAEHVTRLLAATKSPAMNPDIPCLTADTPGAGPYRAQAAGIESDIAAHMGAGPFTPDVYFSVNTTQVAGSTTKMYTYGCTGAQATQSGPVQGCTIHVNPTVTGGSFPASEVHDFLIHELTHCYLFLQLGAAYYHLPSWYVEGAPSWAMTALGNGSNTESKFWLAYLNSPGTPLFQRSYDAIGFFVHLAETGTDVWHKIVPMGQAIVAGGDAAGWHAAAPGEAFLDSWGSGYAEGRYPGSAWQSGDPNLPHYEGPIPQSALNDGQAITVQSRAVAVAISHVDLNAQVVLVTGTGSGRISLDGDADATLVQAAGTAYTTGGNSARCPAGSPGDGAKLTPISSGLHYVAVTGGLAAAAIHLQGLSLASFCGRKAAACIIGHWTSTQYQATNSAGTTEHGAAGVTMSIGPDGAMVVDFGAMAPVVFDGSGASGNFTFGGQVTGQMQVPTQPGATTGVWRPAASSTVDYQSLTVTVQTTAPISETIGPLSVSGLANSLGGGSAVSGEPLSGGTWNCSGNTLVNRSPSGSSADGTWTWTRTS